MPIKQNAHLTIDGGNVGAQLVSIDYGCDYHSRTSLTSAHKLTLTFTIHPADVEFLLNVCRANNLLKGLCNVAFTSEKTSEKTSE